MNIFTKKMSNISLQIFNKFMLESTPEKLGIVQISGLVAFKIAFVMILSCGYFAYPSSAAELPPIDDVVSRLQQTYEQTIDIKADFIQETTIKSIKKTESEEGTVFFKNPKNMLWNYTKPKSKKLVINSRKVWLYLPQEKVAYTQDADYIFQSKVLIKFLTGLGKLKDDFTIEYAKSSSLDKNENYRLVLTPLEKNAAYNTLQITVDKNIFYILQVNFDDTFGNTTSLRFSNIAINSGIATNIFQFKPPSGVSIFNMQ